MNLDDIGKIKEFTYQVLRKIKLTLPTKFCVISTIKTPTKYTQETFFGNISLLCTVVYLEIAY